MKLIYRKIAAISKLLNNTNDNLSNYSISEQLFFEGDQF